MPARPHRVAISGQIESGLKLAFEGEQVHLQNVQNIETAVGRDDEVLGLVGKTHVEDGGESAVPISEDGFSGAIEDQDRPVRLGGEALRPDL